MNKVQRLACVVVAISMLVASSAAAHVNPGGFRPWLDVDLYSIGVVTLDPGGSAAKEKSTVISVGPNEFGSSLVVIPTTPVGIGFAYVLRPAWLLGVRTGLGFDRVSSDNAPNQKVFALSLMPELTYRAVGCARVTRLVTKCW